jgi:hypothetical protein
VKPFSKSRKFNPAYQADRNACAKAYHRRYQSEPLYAELVSVRRRISSRRDLIEATLERVRAHERNLLDLVKRREQLTKLWANRRAAIESTKA